MTENQIEKRFTFEQYGIFETRRFKVIFFSVRKSLNDTFYMHFPQVHIIISMLFCYRNDQNQVQIYLPNSIDYKSSTIIFMDKEMRTGPTGVLTYR